MLNSQELFFFKRTLEEQLSQLQKNLKMTSSELRGSFAQRESDEDNANLSLDSHINSSLLKKQSQHRKEIEEALTKFKTQEYGICEMCDEPINIERLKVKVFAKYCIPCREEVEKRLN